MSINWSWKDKMGEVTDDRGWTSNLYRGNCLTIAVNEYKDETGTDVYNLAWFFADERHMNNCLGLSKDYDSNPLEYHWKKFKLNTRYKETAKIVAALIKTKIPIEIELYYEEAQK